MNLLLIQYMCIIIVLILFFIILFYYIITNDSFVVISPEINNLKNMLPITYVTCYYDLSQIDTTNRPGVKEYMRDAEKLFSLNVYLVIFCEEKNYQIIYDNRKKYGYHEITKIIIKEFKDLPYYKHKEKLYYLKNEKKLPIFNTNIIKDTPNYVIVIHSKFCFLKEVLLTNPFNTNYIGWIDFGISHTANNIHIIETLKLPTKIKCNITNTCNKDFVDLDDTYKKYRGMVSGGFFGGNNENMLHFTNLFDKQVKYFLDRDLSPFEEDIIIKIIIYNPDLFEYSFGRNDNIFNNYKYITNGVDDIIQNFIVNKTNILFSFIAYNQLILSHTKKKINLTDKQLQILKDSHKQIVMI